MKKLSSILLTGALLLATRTLAGTLTINNNLNVVSNLTVQQSITWGGITQTNWPSGSNSGVIDLTSGVIDFSQTGLLYRLTITNNITWIFTNHVAGRLVMLQISENAIGGWTNSWPTTLLWPNGGSPITPDVSSNAIAVFQILDNGTSWLVQAEGLSYQTNSSSYALLFDGNQGMVYTTATIANHLTSTRTVEWWAKASGAGGGFYLGSWQNSPYEYNFLCCNNPNAGQWYVQTGIGTLYITPPTEASDIFSWHHYALVESNSVVTVYIDGSARGSGTASLSMGGTADFEIGNIDTGGSGPAYSGTIDEVRISSRARYTANFTPSAHLIADSDTVALWRLDEGTGNTAHDVTGIHNGTVFGLPSPYWVKGR